MVGCSHAEKRKANEAIGLDESYTYDGKYDPGDFPYWKVVDMGSLPYPPGHVWVRVQNPDTGQVVDLITEMTPPDYTRSRIQGYGYEEDGVEYFFMWDDDTAHYKLESEEVTGGDRT